MQNDHDGEGDTGKEPLLDTQAESRKKRREHQHEIPAVCFPQLACLTHVH